MTSLYQLSNKELPSYTILRDLFDFIDIRKDNIIDIHEWMSAFR